MGLGFRVQGLGFRVFCAVEKLKRALTDGCSWPVLSDDGPSRCTTSLLTTSANMKPGGETESPTYRHERIPVRTNMRGSPFAHASLRFKRTCTHHGTVQYRTAQRLHADLHAFDQRLAALLLANLHACP